jgi:peroxiredoxin
MSSFNQRAGSHRKVTAFLFAIASVIALAIVSWWQFSAHQPAPQVTFKTLDGRTFDTASLKGKVVLVNFWATSCVTCVAEMPRMVETHKTFAAQGFETIAVAMSYDPPNYVMRFAQNKALPFAVALDVDGSVAKGFGDVRMTPTTFLIDKRGKIVKSYLGEPDFAKLQQLVSEKLKEPA